MTATMNDDINPPPNFVPVAVVFEFSLGLLAMAVGWLLGVPVAETIYWKLPAVGWGVAAAGPPLVLAWLCLKCPLPALRRLLGVVDDLLVPLFRHCRIWELAIISLAAGLGEELLFRAVAQGTVAAWVGGTTGVWVGLIVGALLFGLMHPITATYALLAGLIGLYLGWLWIATGNLLVPITTHAVYDFLALLYLIRVRCR